MTVSPCPSGLPVLTLSHDTHTDGPFHAMFGSRKRSLVNIRVVHSHYNLDYKFIPMPEALKIPDAKAAVEKEWEKLIKYRHGS